MKKVIFVSLVLGIMSVINATGLIHKTLPNGMEIAVKENRSNTSVGLYCFVKTGSVNEGEYLGKGISHYLEHIVSSGTTTIRTEADYQEICKRIGASVNAYTTNTATAFHILVDKENKDEALQILSEQIQFCVCDSVEVAREREVILKEIVMRSTPATAKMWQRNNEIAYPNSNTKYPVIGYVELYRTISRDELEAYYHKRYVPNNMVFVAVGDFDAEKMIDKVEKAFIDFPRGQLQPVALPIQNIREGELEFIEEFEFQQSYVMMTTILPAANYSDGIALNAVLDILFEKRQSPLNYKLVEELKLVNYIYGYADNSSVSPFGSIIVRAEVKRPEDVKNVVKIIDDGFLEYSDGKFTQEQIDNLVRRRKARKLLSTNTVENDCNSIGWNLMSDGVPDTYDSNMKIMENLTPQDLEAVLTKYLLPKNRVVFYALPVGGKKLIESSDEFIAEKKDVEKIKVNDNISLLYRYNNEKPLIRGVVFLPISTNLETTENAGTISFMIDLLLRGSKKYNPLEVSEWIEDHAVELRISSNRNGTTLKFKCLNEDYPHLESIIVDGFNNPKFYKDEISLSKDRALESFKRSRSRGETLHREFRQNVIFDNERSKITREEKIQKIQNLSQADLVNLYTKYFNTDEAIITFFGDLTEKQAVNYAKNIFKSVPKRKSNLKQDPLKYSGLDQTFINEYNIEQVNIDICYNAPSRNDEDANAMRVLLAVLKGSRGRIFNAVRGVNDLAYFAFPDYTSNLSSGYLRLYSQTSLDKKDELVSVLTNEIERLKTELISKDEIMLAINEFEQLMKSYMTDNQLPGYMTYYESIGFGYDYMSKSSEILKKISPEKIMEVAKKYLNEKSIIISLPNKDVKLMVE